MRASTKRPMRRTARTAGRGRRGARAPARELRPRRPHRPTTCPPADDPPEETYEDCPWAGGDGGDEDRIDDDRAEGAETDWLYQRRNGYGDIYDPWAPDEVEERRQSRPEREEQGEDDDRSGPATGTRKKKKKKKRKRTGPEDAGFAPDHDKT